VSFWDVGSRDWVVPEGEVGFSSRDRGVEGNVRFFGEGMY
jgi:hypothetical protein